jgi:hypothetical protein
LNTIFTVQLVSAIECAEDEEIHAQLISAEIPNSAYNVSSAVNNNTIIYDANQTFTFPAKNYDPKELLRVMNDDATFPFTVTRDKYTNKLTFTNNTPDSHTLNWTSSLARKLLGYGEAADETVAIHSFFIKSDLASGNVLSTRAGNSTTLQKISVDVNGFGIVYLNQQDYRTISVLQKPSVSFITFRLTDQNDNLLDLNDINFEFSLQFMIFKIPGREGARRRGEEAPPPPPRAVAEPIIQQPPPQPMVEGNDIAIVEEERTADDTHPVEGKTAIEKEAEKSILDHIIDNL